MPRSEVSLSWSSQSNSYLFGHRWPAILKSDLNVSVLCSAKHQTRSLRYSACKMSEDLRDFTTIYAPPDPRRVSFVFVVDTLLGPLHISWTISELYSSYSTTRGARQPCQCLGYAMPVQLSFLCRRWPTASQVPAQATLHVFQVCVTILVDE